MILGGLQKLTLLDYPGHVACTVFTLGCNFRCPFCHNAPLVNTAETPHFDQNELFSFLEKRRGILDGVAVTGGEPLIHKDMPAFLEKIKNMGFSVKLDTNGSFPEMLSGLISSGLVDYVAMDIKNSWRKYAGTAGYEVDLSVIEKSIDLLIKGSVPYEFRTTAVKELHSIEDFSDIGRHIAGAEKYFIQQFKDSGDILCEGYTSPTEQELRAFLSSVREYVPRAELRGV